jgi:hypothetical protein
MKTLKLSTEVTAAMLAQIELDLAALVFDRLMKHREQRVGFFYQRVYPLMFACIRPLSVIGFAAALFLLLERFNAKYLILGFFFLFVFASSFYFGVLSLESKATGFYRRLSMRLSRRYSLRMLKQAKRNAPFLAEYDFRHDLVNYMRVKGDTVSMIWSRRIKGIPVSGKDFTVFFKTPQTPYPTMIILCDDGAGLRQYLGMLPGLASHE